MLSQWYIPGTMGVWGWGLQAPTQPCLAQRGHPGMAGVSDVPLGSSRRELSARRGAGLHGAGAPGCARRAERCRRLGSG